MIALAPPAGTQAPAALTGVAIVGQPVVGEVLTAVPTPPDAVVTEYRWRRCPTATTCARIRPYTASTYTVSDADVGSAIEVRAISATGDVRSPMTAVVTAAPTPTPTPAPTPAPTATPTPTPTATPTPDPDPPDEPENFNQGGRTPAPPPASVAETPPQFLRPFPVVRVKGTLVDGGARISLLRVRAPSTATVDVRCSGPSCRVRRRSFGGGRVSVLERFLRAGARITIRVSKPSSVGKYVQLVIRDGAAPQRRDACLLPGSGKPVECPRA